MLTHGRESAAFPDRVVVVGAGGFVGGAIASRLEANGVGVRRVVRDDVDLLAPEAAERLAALLAEDDAVVLASAIAPVKSLAMLEDNLRLIAALQGALERRPVAHVLNISSDAVYADLPHPIVESSCREPTSLHGVMHLTREIVLAEAAGGAPFATLRPTLVYGADDPHNGYGPNRFRRLALAGEPIVLFGEGEERRDHVLVDDVAELAARIIASRSSGSLNAATGEVTSFRDIAELVVRQLGVDVPIAGSPRSGPMPHGGYRPFDPAAAVAAFPDFRFTSLEQGLRRVHDQIAEPNGG